MTCRDMDGVMDARAAGGALPPEAAEHVAGCDRCRRLLHALDAGPGIPPPAPERMRRIQATLAAGLRPVKPLPSTAAVLSALAISFLIVSTAGALQLHAYGWHVLGLAQKLVVFACLSLGAVVLALSAIGQMRPGSKFAVSPGWLPVGALLLLAAAMAAVFEARPETAFAAHGVRCLRAGLIYTAPGALLSWFWLRRGAALDARLMGATAGAFAALMGIAVLEIHCPNLNLNHILVWHLGVLVVAAVAGAAIGSVVAVLRRRPRYN
jgi:hypothetical protein